MEITKRDWIAMHVNVEIYHPTDILRGRLGRDPTVKEFAEYITAIRYTEADAVMDYIQKN